MRNILEHILNKKINLHTHTSRCKHAVGTDRDYVEKAIEAGFQVLGFSDHMPHFYDCEYTSRIRMDMKQLEDYVQSVESLKKEYEEDIQIFCGLEAEYFPKTHEKTMNYINQFPIDYMILGQHFIDDEPGCQHVQRPGQTEAVLSAHVDRMIEALDVECFTYVAHPDILNFCGEIEVYKKYMIRLLEELKRRNMPVELNLGGFRSRAHYPNMELIRLGVEIGNQFILGVDAHEPEELTDDVSYQELAKRVRDMGGFIINDK